MSYKNTNSCINLKKPAAVESINNSLSKSVPFRWKNIKWNQIDWPVALFLALNPVVSVLLLFVYLKIETFNVSVLVFAIIFAAATNLSITTGYHRLFSHRSFEAHPLVRFVLLLIGASAWQGSALKWSADHRIHHSKVDTDQDPYSIEKGFWYAHIGWLLIKDSTNKNPKAADLEKDWMIRFQHKYFIQLGILMGFVFPLIVGAFLGSWLGGFVIAGGLRIFLTQQSTFFVNSLCHTLGRQTYSDKISARDSVIVAVLTHGEGYHNFHHQFQLDYRNGIRWYQWDPTKWTIWFLAGLGLAKKLKTIPAQEILKARLAMESKRMHYKGFSEEKLLLLKEKILTAQNRIRNLKADYEKLKLDYKNLKGDYQRMKSEVAINLQNKMQQAKADIQIAKIEFKYSLKIWKTYLILTNTNSTK